MNRVSAIATAENRCHECLWGEAGQQPVSFSVSATPPPVKSGVMLPSVGAVWQPFGFMIPRSQRRDRSLATPHRVNPCPCRISTDRIPERPSSRWRMPRRCQVLRCTHVVACASAAARASIGPTCLRPRSVVPHRRSRPCRGVGLLRTRLCRKTISRNALSPGFCEKPWASAQWH